jgi:glutaredoxin-related protein
MKKIIFAAIISILPLLALAQDSGKKQAYYFYGEQCPHCVKVNEYFQANGIYDKYEINKLEFSNPFNTRLLLKFGEKFNSESKGSVPAIAFGDKFLVGDQPIIDNFVSEIDVAENAYELPDPDKIGENETSNDVPVEAKPSGGNKKNYFPVILIAFVVAGGGALVYINRKKI